MITFRYKPERYQKNRLIWRPVADIFFQDLRKNWIELHPYIDSGADVTMIPLSFGKLLGLSVNKSEINQIGGISGSIPAIYRKLSMKIGDHQMDVGVAWALIEEVPPLLGRTDVFDQYEITFKQPRGIVEFQLAKVITSGHKI